MQDFSYLSVRPDAKRYIWVDIKPDGSRPGTVNAALLTELERCLDDLQTQNVRGLVLRFVAATDNTTPPATKLSLPVDKTETLALINHIHHTAEKISSFSSPSVFILNGFCPAGGTALILATDYCIAPFSHATEHCLTENALGLHSSPYVLKRLIERVGTLTAFNILFSTQTGVTLPEETFTVNKFVDACVPDADIQQTAIKFINRPVKKKQAALSEKLSNTLLKALTTSKLRQQLTQHGPLHPSRYPAPYALLDLWRKYTTRTDEETRKAYARSITTLIHSEQSAGLQHTQYLKNKLQTMTERPCPLQHLHIIDGGGADAVLKGGLGYTSHLIAGHCLLQGVKVTLQSEATVPEQLSQHIIEKMADIEQHYPDAIAKLMKNLHIDTRGEGIKSADMILVVDTTSLANQQEKFAELEEYSRPDALLATHSSTIPLQKIAAAMLEPQRLLGIHFCYPASTTPLVEISSTAQTAEGLTERAACYIRAINKLPLPINNSPGLLVNRILMQYILRAIQLHQQGVPHTLIDKAGRQAGMSYGPLELADKIGLDYCLSMAGVLEKALGISIPFHLTNLVKSGKLGRKSGSGFYRYRNNRRLKPPRMAWEGDFGVLQDKLSHQILEEAALCLEEGITEDPDIINAGVIFGTGFAAWTGNPLKFKRNSHGTAGNSVQQHG